MLINLILEHLPVTYLFWIFFQGLWFAIGGNVLHASLLYIAVALKGHCLLWIGVGVLSEVRAGPL